MRTKKSKKANLERKRFLFFEIGLLLALAIVFSSFELGKTETNGVNYGIVSWDPDVDPDILITYPPEIPEPVKPEEVKKPEIPEKLIIVPDDAKEDDIDPGTEDLGDPVDIFVYKDIETGPEPPLDPVDYVLVEEKPLFNGGDVALLRYISENTKYPEVPMKNGIEGKVFVQFVIDVNGKVTAVEALNDPDPYLCKEAERVIASLPDWEPGKQRSIPVPVKYIIPINFKLY